MQSTHWQGEGKIKEEIEWGENEKEEWGGNEKEEWGGNGDCE
tara:strand:- start:452 stop:577 length:126 start_codon:yes stop_codon:yes gene_type:complete